MRREGSGLVRGLALTLAVFALLLCAALMLLRSIGSTSDERQMEMVKEAVRNALVTCYAVEGQYPSNVEYLKEHYGLAYDAEKYIVSCDAFASNVLPEVRVSVKGASGL